MGYNILRHDMQPFASVHIQTFSSAQEYPFFTFGHNQAISVKDVGQNKFCHNPLKNNPGHIGHIGHNRKIMYIKSVKKSFFLEALLFRMLFFFLFVRYDRCDRILIVNSLQPFEDTDCIMTGLFFLTSTPICSNPL
jgi:hypothetical protein